MAVEQGVETFTTTYGGAAAYGLRNSDVEVVVAPGVGAKIVSLRNLRSGREWMWAPPLPANTTRTLEPQRVGTPFDQSSLIGADECFPTIAPCTWRRRALPDHGEVWSIPWILDETAWEEKRLVTRVELPISPFWFERGIVLRDDTLTLRYTVRNIDSKPQEFVWALHPLFTIVEGDRILLPENCTTLQVEAAIGLPLGVRGDSVAWPKPHPGIDLAAMSLGTAGAVKLFAPEKQADWAALQNTTTGDELRMTFQPGSVTSLGIWLTREGWNGYDHVALEPGIGTPDPLDEAVQSWKRFGLAMPGERLTWRVEIALKST